MRNVLVVVQYTSHAYIVEIYLFVVRYQNAFLRIDYCFVFTATGIFFLVLARPTISTKRLKELALNTAPHTVITFLLSRSGSSYFFAFFSEQSTKAYV